MNDTAINWTDLTWNPVSGCNKISPGCDHCYAETLAENRRGTPAFPVGFEVMLRPWKLGEPRKVRAPSLIFVNSMSDLFLSEAEGVPDEYRDEVFKVIRECSAHRFQILTKRAGQAARYFRTRSVPPNAWIGATVESADYLRARTNHLREIPADVRFLSCEPLLGDLDRDGELRASLSGIAWVIGGGESGSHLSRAPVLEARGLVRRRPDRERRTEPGLLFEPRGDRYRWATAMRDACADVGAAFWWKQWGGTRPEGGGRSIDGVEHNGMPTHIPHAMPVGAIERRQGDLL